MQGRIDRRMDGRKKGGREWDGEGRQRQRQGDGRREGRIGGGERGDGSREREAGQTVGRTDRRSDTDRAGQDMGGRRAQREGGREGERDYLRSRGMIHRRGSAQCGYTTGGCAWGASCRWHVFGLPACLVPR